MDAHHVEKHEKRAKVRRNDDLLRDRETKSLTMLWNVRYDKGD